VPITSGADAVIAHSPGIAARRARLWRSLRAVHRRDHHLRKSRCSAPQIMPPSINLPGHDIKAPGNLANRCARCKSLRDDRPLLLRAPPPATLRARQHLNSAHRTISCTGANHSACTGADRRRISLTRARRPLTEDYIALRPPKKSLFQPHRLARSRFRRSSANCAVAGMTHRIFALT
jgi:hypothetical protein